MQTFLSLHVFLKMCKYYWMARVIDNIGFYWNLRGEEPKLGAGGVPWEYKAESIAQEPELEWLPELDRECKAKEMEEAIDCDDCEYAGGLLELSIFFDTMQSLIDSAALVSSITAVAASSDVAGTSALLFSSISDEASIFSPYSLRATAKSCRISVSFSSTMLKRSLKRVKCEKRALR